MSHIVVFSKEYLQQVWGNVISTESQESSLWQKDEWGAWIRRAEYGKKTNYAWRIDHSNHRAIHWENHERTLEKGHPACAVTSSSENKKNKRAD